jgi:hypothetical protein
MAFFMALAMSCIMSFVLIVFRMGLTIEAMMAWPAGWLLGFAVGFPVALVVSPVALKLAHWVTRDND